MGGIHRQSDPGTGAIGKKNLTSTSTYFINLKLLPVALAIFFRIQDSTLEIWTQVRTDDGPFHGLLEFPGGGIEPGESPLAAAVREVEEEVGVVIEAASGTFMGTYANVTPKRTVLLNVFLFSPVPGLEGKGHWLSVKSPELSAPYKDQIPSPNHAIIDDLFRSLLG